MASQFDELRLQVTFVDNASAQLKAIKGALEELGGPTHAQNLERLKKETSEVDEALKKIIETISKGPKGFLELAEKVSIAGVSFGAFILAAEKTSEALGEVTEKLVELGHASILTGVEPAKIKAIEEAYERHGIATKTASQEVTGFAGALDDFSRKSSEIRNQLYVDFPKEEEALRKLVYGPIDRAPDIIAKFNAMKQGAHDVHEYFAKRGDEALGRMLEADILKRFKAPNAAVVTEAIEPVDDAMTKFVKLQVEKAEEYENVTKRISQNWEQISTYMKIGLMDSGLITALKWIDGFLDKWSKYVNKPAQSYKEPTAADFGSGETPDVVTRFGGRRPPSTTAEPPKSTGSARPLPPFPSIIDALKQPGPNAITVPQVMPIAPMSPLMGQPTRSLSTGYEAMPRSQNIEDRRSEWRDRDEQTTKLTVEMRRLNALLSGEEKPLGQQYGMLSLPGAGFGGGGGYGGGYGGGGTSPGGTQPDGRIAPPGAPGGGGGQTVGGGLSTGGAGAHVEGGGGGGAIGPMKGGSLQGSKLEAAKAMVAELRAQGMSEAGIAGIMANVASESGFDPTLREPDQPRFSGEAHFAHGLYQEGGDEWNNYSVWLKKNYPQGDWRDPTLQTRFMAERMKTGAGFGARKDYQSAWQRMQEGSKEEAAEQFVTHYLKPAERYRRERVSKYHQGVPSVEQRIGTPDSSAAADGPPGTNDSTVPAAILAQARRVAVIGGPAAVSAFMKRQGYPKHDAWCGDFAASVIKSVGGTPPQNPSVASNWRRTPGYEEDPTPHPGDIAVRRQEYHGRLGSGRTGQTGSHVTFVEDYDPKTGSFTGIGGNQGAAESGFPASHYQFYHPRLLQQQAKDQDVKEALKQAAADWDVTGGKGGGGPHKVDVAKEAQAADEDVQEALKKAAADWDVTGGTGGGGPRKAFVDPRIAPVGEEDTPEKKAQRERAAEIQMYLQMHTDEATRIAAQIAEAGNAAGPPMPNAKVSTLEAGRKNIDRANAPRTVDGTGNINVKVENVRPRGRHSVLKPIAIPVHSSGDKAAAGHPAPPAATGAADHEAGMAAG